MKQPLPQTQAEQQPITVNQDTESETKMQMQTEEEQPQVVHVDEGEPEGWKCRWICLGVVFVGVVIVIVVVGGMGNWGNWVEEGESVALLQSVLQTTTNDPTISQQITQQKPQTMPQQTQQSQSPNSNPPLQVPSTPKQTQTSTPPTLPLPQSQIPPQSPPSPGSPPLPSQKSHKFLFLRHGESGFNKGWQQLDQSHAPYESYKQIRYTMKMLDVGITDTGRKQAQRAKELLRERFGEIGVVLVSPLRRALETCFIVFGEEKGIQVLVQPLLTEHMKASCDIGGRIQQSYNLYSHRFNFSQIPQQQILNQNWYLSLIPNPQTLSQIHTLSQSLSLTPSNPPILTYPTSTIQIMKTTSLESAQQQRERAKKLKKKLQKMVAETEKMIVLVGHGGIFAIIQAREWNGDVPVRPREFGNAVPEEIQVWFQE